MRPWTRLAAFFGLLLSPLLAMGQSYSGLATSINGKPIPFAQITVCAGQSDVLVQNSQQSCNGQLPLNPPVAPTLTAVTASNPPAGTYEVVVTYVNSAGETIGSVASSITTSGGSLGIQVTSPAAYSNATGWNAYFTTAGETTIFYEQNSSPIAIGTSYTQNAVIATTGGPPPVLTSATAAILPLATIYSNVEQTSTLPNPFSADGNGRYALFMSPGNYTASNSAPGYVTYSFPFVSPLSASGAVSFASINKVVYADQQAGATADVKIANCTAALPSGGICDATGFGATTQSIAATVTVPSGVWLRGSLATKFQPASVIDVFNLSPTARISGIWVDTANLTANTFNRYVFGIGADGQNFVQVGASETTTLENFRITATNQVSNGIGVEVSATSSSTNSVSFVTVRNGRIAGMNSGYFFLTSGTGYITGNTFDNLSNTVGGTQGNGFFMIAGGSIGIIGNQFTNDSFEGGGATSGAGVGLTGTAPIQDNQFVNLVVWDTVSGAVPFDISDAAASDNWFQGRFDGTVTDGAGGNNFINTNVISGAQFIALNSLPQSFAKPITATGTKAALTGTGACLTADITTQTGGSWAGSAKCTNTTGASTFTITPGTTAPNGWNCNGTKDMTTPANILNQTSNSATSCTLTASSITANDIIVFSAVAY